MEINTKNFYLLGIICFTGIGIFNFITLVQSYRFMLLTAVISSSLSIIFNFVVVGFFYWLGKNTLEPVIEEGEDIEELKKMVEGLNGKRPRNN